MLMVKVTLSESEDHQTIETEELVTGLVDL